MKSFSGWLALVVFVLPLAARAQSVARAVSAADVEVNPPAIIERGLHHRVWKTERAITNSLGELEVRVGSVVELATGMHYQENGEWKESREEFVVTATGAEATQGGIKVTLAANLNNDGAVDIQTPDGQRLRGHILGLAYFDTGSGKNILIAEIKDRIGELLSSKNQVLYRDAFTDFKADVRYTYGRRGFEQDIILRENPPSPAEYGLNPETTRLEVLTEFLQPPVPEKETRVLSRTAGQLQDEVLKFGTVRMNEGKAFSLPGQPAGTRGGGGSTVPVGKRWQQLEGRDFLIEAVEYPALKPQLDTLPSAPQVSVSKAKKKQVAGVRQLPKKVVQDVRRSKPMQMASLPVGGKGVVIDYYLMQEIETDFTFRGDTTYYVSGFYEVDGAINVEGGAVIKYANTNTAALYFWGNIQWPESAYRPAFFTAKDDDTVGEIIPGSTGTPTNYYAYTAIDYGGSNRVQNIRVSHARTALATYDTYEFHNLQILHCGTGFEAWNGGGGQISYVRNALFNDVNLGFFAWGHRISVEHLTFNVGSNLFHRENFGDGNPVLFFTNSLIVGVTNVSYTFAVTNQTVTLASSNGVFQTVGGGALYLADGSPYRDIGTNAINAGLAASLTNLTTHPPLVLTNLIATNTMLAPRAIRDTNTPDLGYHYAALDYVAGGVMVATNVTMTLTNGVAFATYGNYGFCLSNNSALTSLSGPLAMNRLARYQAVQENRSVANWNAVGEFAAIKANASSPPAVTIRATEFHLLGSSEHALFAAESTNTLASLTVRDSAFYGGRVHLTNNGDTHAIILQNNLFLRVTNEFGSVLQLSLYNNLFKNSGAAFQHNGTNAWVIKDNTFDNTVLSQSGTGTVNHGYNVYIVTNLTNFTRLTPTNSPDYDVVLTNFTYQTGALGSFYQPTNSALTNLGSRTASAATLGYYTTTTNQAVDTGTVDIGLHYVALNGSGQPPDSDGDGVPDYLEQINGTDPNDYYNGTLPLLSIVSGNNQVGWTNIYLTNPLVVLVTNASGVALGSAPVTFTVTAGSALIATSTNGPATNVLSLTTSGSGQASVYVLLGGSWGVTNTIAVSAASGTNSTSTNCIESTYVKVATPTFSPTGGTFVVTQAVTVTCATPGVTIRYTITGVDPVEADTNIVASGSTVPMLRNLTLKAVAWKDGCLPSDVQSGVFNITGAIASGYNHTLVLKSDGTVLAWGLNNNGQLGDNTITNGSSFVTVTNLTNVTAIEAGDTHSLALKSDGTVWAWGDNANGRLGDGTTTDRHTPVKATNLMSVIAIAAGGAHSMALKSDGTVWAWGLNTFGRLGDGTGTQRTAPTNVVGISNIIAIAAGDDFSLALDNAGLVWAWGNGASGRLGNGATTNCTNAVLLSTISNVTAIAAGGDHSLALLSDGTVKAWGEAGSGQLGYGGTIDTNTPVTVTNLSNVVAISAGFAHSLALTSTNTVRAWGLNTYGRLGDGTTTQRNTNVAVSALSGVIAVAAGKEHSAALLSDGTVAGWGHYNLGQLGLGLFDYRPSANYVSGMTNITAIGAGGSHSLVVVSNTGAMRAWGNNSDGQLGNSNTVDSAVPVAVNTISNIIRVDAGTLHSMAVNSNGTLWAWGDNGSGRLGDGTPTQRTSPVQVTNQPSYLSNVIAVAAGDAHTLALLSDGTVRAWGNNGSGRLGDGTGTSHNTNVVVAGLANIVSIAAGDTHSLAVDSGGYVWAWGNGANGRLGTGGTTNCTNATLLTSISNAVSVAAGSAFSLALLSNGTVMAWGESGNGQTGYGGTVDRTNPITVTNLTNVAAIACGDAFALALLSNGTVRAWGLNTDGQLGDGTTVQRNTNVMVIGISNLVTLGETNAVAFTVTNVVAIAAGDTHALALLADGAVLAWGNSLEGQLGDNVNGFMTIPVRARNVHLINWDDVDGDGLLSWYEIQIGTNPDDPDSDHDGMPDGWEVTYSLNPLVDDSGEDPDGDCASNLLERDYLTNPLNAESYPTMDVPEIGLVPVTNMNCETNTNQVAYSYGLPDDNLFTGTDPTNAPNYRPVVFGPVLTNGGVLALATFTYSCDPITNLALATNQTWDVFGGVALSTHAPWQWLGRFPAGVTNLTVTNMTSLAGFFLMASTTNSDADSLTDAYERIVSKSNPTNAFTAGDGISDEWKVLNGIDPNTPYPSLKVLITQPRQGGLLP